MMSNEFTPEIVMKFLPAQSSWICYKSLSSKLICQFKDISIWPNTEELSWSQFLNLKCSGWANYKVKSTPPTLCTGDALNETFWNNKVICVAEKPLFKKNLVKKAIIKLKLVL